MAKNGNVSNNQNKNRALQGSQQPGGQPIRSKSRTSSVEFSEEFCCENDSSKSSSCDKK